MNGPLLSIIVPIYNTQEYIEKCVNALLAQTYKNIQVILVDDGSSDSSPQICDKLADEHENVKCIHQKNSGILYSRLNGVAIADGEYIGFTDSDDYIEPNMYEILVKNIIDVEAGISHCGYKMVFDGGEKLFYGTGKKIEQNQEEGVRDLLEGKFIEPTLCTKIFKASLFDGVGCPYRVDYFEDVLLNFQLFKKAQKSIYEDVVLYHYIRRGSSISKSFQTEKYINDSYHVMEQMDALSQNDSNIRTYVERRIVTQWVNGYNLLRGSEAETQNAWKEKIPKYRKGFRKNTTISFWLIKHMPLLYEKVRKFV